MPTLEITTTLGCPVNCTVCPQTLLKSVYSSPIKCLSFDSFSQILSKIPKHVRIDFSGMSEPWSNSDCTQMLKHTLESGYDVAIYTTLVGMTKQDVDYLYEAILTHKTKIAKLCIHLPDANKNMRGWSFNENYQYALKLFLETQQQTIRETIDFDVITMDKNNELHPSLESYKTLPLPFDTWYGHTRAESLSLNDTNKPFVAEAIKHVNPVTCRSTPFYDHNVVLPNGDVVLCCMDYGLTTIIGNLLTQSYEELYLSDTMINLMKENRKGGWSKCSICKSCINAQSYVVNKHHWFKI